MRHARPWLLLGLVSAFGFGTGCTCVTTGPNISVCSMTFEEPFSVQLRNLDHTGRQPIWISPETETDQWIPSKELLHNQSREIQDLRSRGDNFSFRARRAGDTILGTVICVAQAGQAGPTQAEVTWDGTALHCVGDWQARGESGPIQ